MKRTRPDIAERITEAVGRIRVQLLKELIGAGRRAGVTPARVVSTGSSGYLITDLAGREVYARERSGRVEFTTLPSIFSSSWRQRTKQKAMLVQCDPGVERRFVRWSEREKTA